MPLKEEELVGDDEDEETASLSEAGARGSLFQPEDVASKDEEEVPGTPGHTQLPLLSLLGPQGNPRFFAPAEPKLRRSLRCALAAALDDASTGSTLTDDLSDVVNLATHASVAAPESTTENHLGQIMYMHPSPVDRITAAATQYVLTVRAPAPASHAATAITQSQPVPTVAAPAPALEGAPVATAAPHAATGAHPIEAARALVLQRLAKRAAARV
jgi:hypothetical protein